MKIERQNGTLAVHDLQELSADNARSLQDQICAAFSPTLKYIEIDLSQINFVDACGLGALASVYAAASEHCHGEIPIIRLVHPQPSVQQLLELTRLHHIFEIVPPHGGMINERALSNHSVNSAGPE